MRLSSKIGQVGRELAERRVVGAAAQLVEAGLLAAEHRAAVVADRHRVLGAARLEQVHGVERARHRDVPHVTGAVRRHVAGVFFDEGV